MGLERDRLLKIDVVVPPLVPLLYPERSYRAPRHLGLGRYAPLVKRSRIPRDQWPLVRAPARQQGLRATVRAFGVSHETIRTILRAHDDDGAVGVMNSSATDRKRGNSTPSAA